MHHAISFILRFAYAAVFGVILVVHTTSIIEYIPQLLGGLLMLESVSQVIELFMLRFRTQELAIIKGRGGVGWGYFVVPGLILLYSLFLIFACSIPSNMFQDLHLTTMFKIKVELKIAGFCFLSFLISELVISAVFFKPLFMTEKYNEEKKIAIEAAKLQTEAIANATADNTATCNETAHTDANNTTPDA